MPSNFADRMIDDAIQSIRDTDLFASEAKPRLIAKVLALRQQHCVTRSCGECSIRWRCEDRIGAILNDEVDAAPLSPPGLWVVESNAA